MTYRDLGSNPLPHLDAATGLARVVPPELRTPAQAASWALTEELVNEIKEADTILLGLPLYNYGAPSSVKAWVDHLIAPGLSVDPETHAPPPRRHPNQGAARHITAVASSSNVRYCRCPHAPTQRTPLPMSARFSRSRPSTVCIVGPRMTMRR